MSEIIPQKYCASCDTFFLATSECFHKNVKLRDQLNNICKKCNNKKSVLWKQKKRSLLPPKEKRTHCFKGHLLSSENTRTGSHAGGCKTCNREQAKIRSQKKINPNKTIKQKGFCLHGHALIEENLRTGKHKNECLTYHRESAKRRYHKNPQEMVKRSTAYRKTHKEQVNMRFKKYREQDSFKNRSKLSNLRQRAKKRSNNSFLLENIDLYRDSQDKMHVENLLNDPCCYCGKPMEDIDHIVPVTKSGEENWENLTAACKSCNTSKNNKNLLDFLLYRLKYRK
jgi:5-methylcytosine-specific restriction endonuclease McrA